MESQRVNIAHALKATESVQKYDMPSRKAILQYLVRMGSFTSAPKIPNEDNGDKDAKFPSFKSECLNPPWNELSLRCETELKGEFQESISRDMVDVKDPSGEKIRIMQWNVLAQALAEGSDQFVNCPSGALLWESRRWRILTEIAAIQPDILCMQEVDHFQFFQRAMSSVGLTGFFCPKPDSPCLYVPGNNGPDGCALFVNTVKFEILETKSRCLEIWGVSTNQVAIFCKLKRRSDGSEFWVATTHLKARPGTFLAALREIEGADLIDFMKITAGNRAPLVLTGDMNAEPNEPVHAVLKSAGLESAYINQEPSYTSWTVREDGEHCSTLDYILYRQQTFHVERLLRIPAEEDIGQERVPSYKYPSDHFALVADLILNEDYLFDKGEY